MTPIKLVDKKNYILNWPWKKVEYKSNFSLGYTTYGASYQYSMFIKNQLMLKLAAF